jgi:hypothetical protein
MALFFPRPAHFYVWGEKYFQLVWNQSHFGSKLKTPLPHKTHNVQNKGSFHKMRLLLFMVVQALMGRKFSTWQAETDSKPAAINVARQMYGRYSESLIQQIYGWYSERQISESK